MTESPYSSPRNAENRSPDVDVCETYARRKKFWLKWIWSSLAGVIIPPIFGLLGTVIGMTRAFGKLGKGQEPEQLAGDISFSLWTTMIGNGIALISCVIFIIALIQYATLRNVTKYRTK